MTYNAVGQYTIHRFNVFAITKYSDIETRVGVIQCHWKWHHSIYRNRTGLHIHIL